MALLLHTEGLWERLSYNILGTQICLLYRVFEDLTGQWDRRLTLANSVIESRPIGQMLHDAVTCQPRDLLMKSHISLRACGPVKLKQCASERCSC